MACKQFYSNLILRNRNTYLAGLLFYGVGFFVLVTLNAELPNFFKSSYTTALSEAKYRIAPDAYKQAFQKQLKQPGAKGPRQVTRDEKPNSGYLKFEQSLLPVPQQVSFSGQSFSLKGAWQLILGSTITSKEPAVQSLLEGLQTHSDIKLSLAQKPKENNA